MMREKYLPVRPSRLNCFLLIGWMVFLYLLDNPYTAAFFGSMVFSYVIKPILWMGTAYAVWLLPRIKARGQLKLRGIVNWWAFIFAVIFIAVSAMAGIIDGFGKSPYSHSITGIAMNILMVGSMFTGREFIRNYLVNSFTDKENYIVFVLIALLMAFINMPICMFMNLEGYESIVKFTAQYFAPEFCHDLLAVYMAFLGGTLPSAIYRGIILAFHWLSPILPNLKWITAALVGIMCPIFCLSALQNIYIDESKKIKYRDKVRESPLSLMVTSIISISIVWFSVGIFPLYPSVIATGSMKPLINPGDVIIVKKTKDLNGLKTGDIIQFKRERILITHRIVELVEERKEKVYRTKGDNNSIADAELVKPEQVKGEVVQIVPKIGWPSLLMRSDRDIPLEEVEF